MQDMPSSLVRPTYHAEHAFAGQRILICGASGNLGGHLARELAQQGARLLLWGRDRQKLAILADQCERTSVEVQTRSIDLFDAQAAIAALIEDDEQDPLDCAFFVSGAGDTLEPGRIVESPSQVARLINVNYLAPAALAVELGERMARRGKGRIAIAGTAAATHPLPLAAGYASSKCGLSLFAEAIRIALRPHGVSVTLISPGFFSAGKNHQLYGYARPGEISANLVARRSIAATAERRAELVTPGYFLALRWIGHILPRFIKDRLLRSLPSR